MSALERVIKEIGGAGVAKVCGVAPPNVTRWLSSHVPAHHVIAICAAVDWRVTPHQVRPDIYPYPFDAVPIEARK